MANNPFYTAYTVPAGTYKGQDSDVSTVTVHIKHIRDKIELNPDRTQYIETVWGVGYKFEVNQ
mgnify:CR=1 FL=1